MLSTTIRELRDEATIYLIEFGKKYPINLLELTLESSQFKDIYIYERLVSCCYGVALNLQNDVNYLNVFLPKIASSLYEQQFSVEPKASVYNYIVIDSIKHLLDLAVLKGVISFEKDDYQRISNYEFIPPYDWKLPTEEEQYKTKASHERSRPKPIGMDFGIYTIPRLLKRNGEISENEAIANVYKRILELGYIVLEDSENQEKVFRDFYWGNRLSGINGKVDKLGKKYSWIAFFDYAGYLLLIKKLNVFEDFDTENKYFKRLSDVDIDISIPNKNYLLSLRLYNDSLLDKRKTNPN